MDNTPIPRHHTAMAAAVQTGMTVLRFAILGASGLDHGHHESLAEITHTGEMLIIMTIYVIIIT